MFVFNKFVNRLKAFEDSQFAWLCYLFIFGMFFSRAGLAIGSVLLLIYSVITYFKKPFQLSLKPVQILFFSIYAVSVLSVIFISENVNYGLALLFKNAMLLTLPLTFLFIKSVSTRTILRVFLLFLLLATLSVTVNSVNVLLNFNQFLQDIGDSKNAVSLIGASHAELNVLSVVAFVLGAYLAMHLTSAKHKLVVYIVLAILFLSLQIVAYRFSVVSIYTIIFAYIVLSLLKKKQFKLLFVSVLMLFAIIYTVTLMPPVKARLQNTVNDITTISRGRNPNFQSITQRILAIHCAIEVIKDNPWFGVSPADAKVKIQEQYVKNSYLLIPENRVFIHNQFVFYILCFGLPIGVLLGFSLLFLIFKNAKRYPLLFWTMLPFVFHMMVENTLERQITANALIFVFLVLHKYQHNLESEVFVSANN